MKNKFLIYPLIFLIKTYQLVLSPLFGKNCRYLPTCSEYFITALNNYGLLKGCLLGIKRLFKCHPFGGSGYDPVHEFNKKEIK
tara:strand:+ start:1804 stop:2052 length:249 start_codon:yes stop_codon:yes gene_type:complete